MFSQNCPIQQGIHPDDPDRDWEKEQLLTQKSPQLDLYKRYIMAEPLMKVEPAENGLISNFGFSVRRDQQKQQVDERSTHW